MTTSESIDAIAAALSKAQGAMTPAVKDSENPHFHSKFASLAANVEAARPHLAVNGLSVIQEATGAEGCVAVATRILHASGQWIQFQPLIVPVSKADAQGVGSATTYLRRYSLASACGVAQEDDDGNSSAHDGKPSAKPVDKPVAKISAEQEATVLEWIESTKSDKGKLLEAYKVKSLTDLTEAQASNAIARLKAKVKEAA